MILNRQQLFPKLPQPLVEELVNAYDTIVMNFREGRWEPSELNGGKLCEVAYTIIRGQADGKYPARAKKPRNMVDACKLMEAVTNPSTPRSFRIQIPRVIAGLYEVRNNRGVGHVGGDVNPNQMDSSFVLSASKWIVAELIRVFHNVTINQAAQVVEAITQRTLPIVWEFEGIKRVLNPKLPMTDQTLLLLYATPGKVNVKEITEWVGYSNPSTFRKNVLRRLHRKRLIELNEKSNYVVTTTSGIAFVEKNIPLEI